MMCVYLGNTCSASSQKLVLESRPWVTPKLDLQIPRSKTKTCWFKKWAEIIIQKNQEIKTPTRVSVFEEHVFCLTRCSQLKALQSNLFFRVSIYNGMVGGISWAVSSSHDEHTGSYVLLRIQEPWSDIFIYLLGLTLKWLPALASGWTRISDAICLTHCLGGKYEQNITSMYCNKPLLKILG